MSEDATIDEFVETDSGSSEQETEDLARKTVCGIPPQDWTVARLGKLVRVVSGNSLPTDYQNGEEGEHPVYKVSDMNAIGNQKYVSNTSNRLSKEDLEKINHTLYPEGTTILPKVGAALLTNKRRLLTEPSSFDNNVMGWVPNEINPEFLYYVSCMIDMEAVAQKGAVPSISKAIAKSLKLPSPPLPEQHKIATVLYTIDRAIEKTEKVIEQVRTVKQGILQDLMNGVGSDHPLEEKRVGPRVVSLPKDWEVVQIGDALEREIILEQQDGNHGSDYPRKDEFVNEGVPYLSAEMLSEGEVDFSQAKYLTKERANQLRIGFAKDGDVLLAHNATVGPTGLLETNREFVIIGTSLTYYRCNPDKLDSQYLTYFFQSGTFQKQLQDVMRQSTRNQVPITRQRNLHLILPPIQKQREISNQIDTVNKKLQTENQYQERLQRLKRGLMQDLLSGTVRTTDTNIEVPDEIAQHG